MPTTIKLWIVQDEKLTQIQREKLNWEYRIENWILQDISLIDNDLLIIGQQVNTDYGGFIDLLCIDLVGNLVIVELKRDKTPRDVVAQILDYASWVGPLEHDEVQSIANTFLSPMSLEQAFRDKFKTELPEVLNERHRMYIVASSIDSATERIVKYLSESHKVDINIATFSYFKTTQGEILGRSLLLDDEQVLVRAETASKRQPPRTLEELRGFAEQCGVLELYDKALSELRLIFDGTNRTRTNVAFIGTMGDKKSRNVIMGIYPEASNSSDGLAIMLDIKRLNEYLNLSDEDIKPILIVPAKDAPTNDPESTWFFNGERLDKLLYILKRAKMKYAAP